MQETSSTTSSLATRQYLRFGGPCFALDVIRYDSKSLAGRFCRNVVREVLTISGCASLLLPILITRSRLRGFNCTLPVRGLISAISEDIRGDASGTCTGSVPRIRRTQAAGSISPIRTGPDRVGLSEGLFGAPLAPGTSGIDFAEQMNHKREMTCLRTSNPDGTAVRVPLPHA